MIGLFSWYCTKISESDWKTNEFVLSCYFAFIFFVLISNSAKLTKWLQSFNVQKWKQPNQQSTREGNDNENYEIEWNLLLYFSVIRCVLKLIVLMIFNRMFKFSQRWACKNSKWRIQMNQNHRLILVRTHARTHAQTISSECSESPKKKFNSLSCYFILFYFHAMFSFQ